jgi:hypothetical protein
MQVSVKSDKKIGSSASIESEYPKSGKPQIQSSLSNSSRKVSSEDVVDEKPKSFEDLETKYPSKEALKSKLKSKSNQQM